MYIHLVYYSYWYKNDPDTEHEGVMLVPKATSSEARVYFWYNLATVDTIEWSEVDQFAITLVHSSFVPVAS